LRLLRGSQGRGWAFDVFWPDGVEVGLFKRGRVTGDYAVNSRDETEFE